MSAFDQIIQQASAKYNVPANLIKKVLRTESAGKPKATSHKGAMGLMQLMPGTAKMLGVTDPYDPTQNIMGGTKYLSQMLKQFGNNPALALAAYNAGPGAVKKYGGIPPYKETQNYVKKILGGSMPTSKKGSTMALPTQPTQAAQVPNIEKIFEAAGYKKPSKVSKTLGDIGLGLSSVAPLLQTLTGDVQGGAVLSQLLEQQIQKREAPKQQRLKMLLDMMKPSKKPTSLQEFEYYQGLDPSGQASFRELLEAKKYSPMADVQMMKAMQMQNMMKSLMGDQGGLDMPQTGGAQLTPAQQKLLDRLNADDPTLTDAELDQIESFTQ